MLECTFLKAVSVCAIQTIINPKVMAVHINMILVER